LCNHGELVSETPSQPVTELLVLWRAGDRDALEKLIPFVYDELRVAARRQLRHERPDRTLESAALVN